MTSGESEHSEQTCNEVQHATETASDRQAVIVETVNEMRAAGIVHELDMDDAVLSFWRSGAIYG